MYSNLAQGNFSALRIRRALSGPVSRTTSRLESPMIAASADAMENFECGDWDFMMPILDDLPFALNPFNDWQNFDQYGGGNGMSTFQT